MGSETPVRAGRTLAVAVTQWRATGHLTSNLDIATSMILEAGRQHADLVALPENGLCLGTNREMRAAALRLDAPAINSLRNAAKEANTTVVLGGFKRNDESGRVFNTALVIGSDGEIRGRYDKIHLFDANIGGQTFAASSVECGGDTPVILSIRGVKIGVTICYDIRFPELYRQLALAGAEVVLIPAAFTYTTGRAHWEILLRARAIENSTYVVAPATVRGHEGGDSFQTYGHAMIITPWGEVLTDLGEAQRECQVLTLDLDRVAQVRDALPVLRGVRPAAYGRSPRIINASALADANEKSS